MQKGGILAQQIAQDFIGMDIGDRVFTVEEFSNKYEAARGTVQQAMTRLKEYHAIDLESKGHLGTYIKEINYAKLMEICSAGSLVGVMPLPYSKRYEGLASGIYAILNQETGISVNLAFMGGASRRIQDMISGRYNFAIISLATAKHYVKEGYEIQIIHSLGIHTYVNAHSLIMRSDYQGKPKRIGVDRTSFDQLSMTTKYFENQLIEMVPLRYAHILDNIKNKTIDAAIWSLEEKTINDKELKYEYLEDKEADGDNTKAAIVVKKGDVTITNFLKRFFDCQKVTTIQEEVLKNKTLPNY